MAMVGRGRGAVRSEAARMAILRATAEQLAERGWGPLTIEGIAQAAGVGKPTIYRWWPSKSALLAEALSEGVLLHPAPSPADTGNLRTDLASWLDETFRFSSDPESTAIFRALIAAAAEDDVVGARLEAANPAPEALAARLAAGRERGELPQSTDPMAMADALFGTVVLRTMRRAAYSPGDAEALVDSLLGPTP